MSVTTQMTICFQETYDITGVGIGFLVSNGGSIVHHTVTLTQQSTNDYYQGRLANGTVTFPPGSQENPRDFSVYKTEAGHIRWGRKPATLSVRGTWQTPYNQTVHGADDLRVKHTGSDTSMTATKQD